MLIERQLGWAFNAVAAVMLVPTANALLHGQPQPYRTATAVALGLAMLGSLFGTAVAASRDETSARWFGFALTGLLFDRVVDCHVVVEEPHRHSAKGKKFHVRINLHVPGKELVISKNPESAKEDLHVAIDDAFTDAERVLEEACEVVAAAARAERWGLGREITRAAYLAAIDNVCNRPAGGSP